ncbi:poly(A)-specific ribonuclease PARN [Tetranychus urticae]|uniref:Poly(A)-specific ribonuclease RNA-binding domain-containing protein n=1 Tax=Tetranychus urticae TaxID=32264 RepID=T1KBC6_TETUR|nr:poly(A)-specific ribonuclease PARN [Tetranychus urticae]
MDVVRSNFVELLPKIRNDIKTCDFIAIDTELSGLGQNGNSFFDTLEERYLKIKNSISQYLLIQYGLSCFTKSSTDNSYSCASYNFYIFPYKVPGANNYKDKSFLCQPSALTFLSGHNFDFNKWIREGISYMNLEEEAHLTETLKNKNVSVNTTINDLDSTVRSLNESSSQLVNTNHVPDDQKDFIENFMSGLNDFFNDSTRTKWNVDPCSPYRRKLIFQSVASLNMSGLKLTSCQVTENSSERFISIEKVSAEQKAKEEAQLIDEAVGFTKVVQELIDCKKPIVGHNLLLDMAHTVHHFIGPLPDTLVDFKEMLSELCPYTYDTKLMAKFDSKLDSQFQNTALNDLYNVIQKAPFSNIKAKIINRSDSDEKTSFHNASYDSYITGLIFLNMLHYLSPKNQKSILDSSEFTKFRGKYNLTFSFDLAYLDINKDQKNQERSNVFHLTFPPTWTRSEIYDLLSPFKPGQIGWIDSTSALIALNDVNGVKDIDRVLTIQKNSSVCTIKSYRAFMDEKSPSQVPNSGKRKSNHFDGDKVVETSTPIVKKFKPTPVKPEIKMFAQESDWS